MTSTIPRLKGIRYGLGPKGGTQFGTAADIYLILGMMLLYFVMLVIALIARAYLGVTK